MTLSASQLLPLIVLLPLVGAAVNGFIGHKLPRGWVFGIGVGSVAIAFILALRAFLALHAVAHENHNDPVLSTTVWTWITSGFLSVDVAFYLDPLSSVMLLIVTGVGLLIHIYSTGYMKDDPSVARYFSYLNLFMFSMLVLILGKNLLMLFVGWEGVGLCSYLLIGFWFTDDQKAQAGQKAFVVNRVGDFGFIIGLILLLYYTQGTTDYDILKWHFGRGAYGPFPDPKTLFAACLLMFVGACGKSAQIPLYIWLPDAMAGPTPVSALIHAATMVTAGVYMIARMSFMYTLSPDAMEVVACVGAATAIVAALVALSQRDIKKVLAYSTVSQLGYMILAVGVGAYVAGIFHLMTHAFFKALLFLGAGSVIHGMSGEQDIFKMGGLKKKMPITRMTFLIGTLAIAGVPLLSGFFSKDEILWDVLTKKQQLPIPEAASAGWTDGTEMILAGKSAIVLRGKDGNWCRTQLGMADAPAVGPSARGIGQRLYPALRTVTRTPDGTVWAAGEAGVIFQGDKLSFQPDGVQRALSLNASFAQSDQSVWFAGERGLVVHWDGQAFQTLNTGTTATFFAVAGRGSDLYLGGAEGTLLKSDGVAWKVMTSPSSSPITAFAVASDTIYATTGTGGLLKLGAEAWEKVGVEAPGLDALGSLTAATVLPTGEVALGGSGKIGGDPATRPIVLTRAGTTGPWAVSVGEPGVSIKTLLYADGTLHAAGDGKALLTQKGATLEREGSVPSRPPLHLALYIVALCAAALTAFYMFRLYFLTFEGATRADHHAWDHAHESPTSMTLPLMILAVLAIFGGYIGTPLFGHATELLQHWLAPSFSIAESRLEPEHDVALAWKYAGLSAAIALGGIGVAWAFYMGALKDMPGRIQGAFESVKGLFAPERLRLGLGVLVSVAGLALVAAGIAWDFGGRGPLAGFTLVALKGAIYAGVATGAMLLVYIVRIGLDEFFNQVVVGGFRATARTLHSVVDVLIIDTVLVRGWGYLAMGVGKMARFAQTGDVQQYAVAIVVGLAALIWYMGA